MKKINAFTTTSHQTRRCMHLHFRRHLHSILSDEIRRTWRLLIWDFFFPIRCFKLPYCPKKKKKMIYVASTLYLGKKKHYKKYQKPATTVYCIAIQNHKHNRSLPETRDIGISLRIVLAKTWLRKEVNDFVKFPLSCRDEIGQAPKRDSKQKLAIWGFFFYSADRSVICF